MRWQTDDAKTTLVKDTPGHYTKKEKKRKASRGSGRQVGGIVFVCVCVRERQMAGQSCW